MSGSTRLMDEQEMAGALARMARQIVELAGGPDHLVLVGIQRRGVELADRLAALIERAHGSVGRGKLDITLYRDDLQQIGPRPIVGETSLPPIDGAVVVVVDDVLYTGRTARAALDEFADFGRPRRVLLAVLVDRGGRELPIQPDIVGVRMDAAPGERVDVSIRELDGHDAVDVVGGNG